MRFLNDWSIPNSLTGMHILVPQTISKDEAIKISRDLINRYIDTNIIIEMFTDKNAAYLFRHNSDMEENKYRVLVASYMIIQIRNKDIFWTKDGGAEQIK